MNVCQPCQRIRETPINISVTILANIISVSFHFDLTMFEWIFFSYGKFNFRHCSNRMDFLFSFAFCHILPFILISLKADFNEYIQRFVGILKMLTGKFMKKRDFNVRSKQNGTKRTCIIRYVMS